MRSLIKLLSLAGDLIAWIVRVKQQEKQREEINTIRRDPVAAFRNEFAGVPDSEAGLPSGKAGIEVDASK